MILENKRILLGITGGIAAYKSAELVRLLCDAGAEVQVVMTQAAEAFIAPLTLQALSGRAVRTSLFDSEAERAMSHITLARTSALVLIAPASADFIAKLAHGFAEDLLSTLCLATTSPIVLVPSMNKEMWSNPATQANIKTLSKRGVKILGPETGSLACGEWGAGRMMEPQTVLTQLPLFFSNNLLKGVKVVITAGPTREKIDPVRYISNKSSGKMGYALAEAAFQAGASVVLISGPTDLNPPSGVHFVAIDTAQAMYEAVISHIAECTIFIGVAAVSDFRPREVSFQKIKKGENASLTLELSPTPDILSHVAALEPKPYVIGFAAETENLLENARKKMITKKADMLIANQVGDGERGFDSDDNEVDVLVDDRVIHLPLMLKSLLAAHLIEIIASARS